MLCFSKGQVSADARVHQLFKHLGGRTQNRDRSVRCALVFGLTGFEDGEDNRLFPNCWQVGSLVREVKKLRQILNAKGSQMFQLVDGESIRTRGSRVAAEADSVMHLVCCERFGCVVERVTLVDTSGELSCCTVMAVW